MKKKLHTGRHPKTPNCHKFAAAFGDAVRERRRFLGLSLTDMTHRMPHSKGGLSLIERGLRVPSLWTFIHLCQALRISGDQLLVHTSKRLLP